MEHGRTQGSVDLLACMAVRTQCQGRQPLRGMQMRLGEPEDRHTGQCSEIKYQPLVAKAARNPMPRSSKRRRHPVTIRAMATKTSATGNVDSLVASNSPTTAPTAAIRRPLGLRAYHRAETVRIAPSKLTRLSFVTKDERKTNLGKKATIDAPTTGVHGSDETSRMAKYVTSTVSAPRRMFGRRSQRRK